MICLSFQSGGFAAAADDDDDAVVLAGLTMSPSTVHPGCSLASASALAASTQSSSASEGREMVE